jgi:hypothetical protein
LNMNPENVQRKQPERTRWAPVGFPISQRWRIAASRFSEEAMANPLMPRQAQTAAELDALLSAVLDKGCKGGTMCTDLRTLLPFGSGTEPRSPKSQGRIAQCDPGAV